VALPGHCVNSSASHCKTTRMKPSQGSPKHTRRGGRPPPPPPPRETHSNEGTPDKERTNGVKEMSNEVLVSERKVVVDRWVAEGIDDASKCVPPTGATERSEGPTNRSKSERQTSKDTAEILRSDSFGILMDEDEILDGGSDGFDAFEDAMVDAGFGSLDHSSPPEGIGDDETHIDISVVLDAGEQAVVYDLPRSTTVATLKKKISELAADGAQVPLPRDQLLVFEGQSLLDDTQTLRDVGGPQLVNENRWMITCLCRPSSLPKELDPSFWTPDAATNACELCDASFNPVRRRHHCRKCGKLVCHACSDHTELMLPLKPQISLDISEPTTPAALVKPMRICDVCAGVRPDPMEVDHGGPTTSKPRRRSGETVTPAFKALVTRCLVSEGAQYLVRIQALFVVVDTALFVITLHDLNRAHMFRLCVGRSECRDSCFGRGPRLA